MLYYKVKPEYDNQIRYKWTDQGGYVPDGILIADELYTSSEFTQIANNPICFEKVDTDKENAHFFFRARFEGSWWADTNKISKKNKLQWIIIEALFYCIKVRRDNQYKLSID